MATSKPELYRELEEVLCCPLCLDRCSQPRSLPCLHTFCLACLNQFIKKSAEKGNILCPTCRAKAKVPQGGAKEFPDAFLWKTLGETVDKLQELKVHQNPCCTLCKEHGRETEATKLCTDCMKTFCDECVKSHNVLLNNHNIFDCKNVKPDDLNEILKSKTDVCPTHKEDKIRMFCKTCQQTLCMMCAMLDHATHTKLELAVASAAHTENLQEKLKQMEQRAEQCKQFLSQIDQTKRDCTSEVKSKTKILDQHGVKVIETTKLLIEETKSEIVAEGNKCVNDLDALQETIQLELSQLLNSAKSLKTSLKINSAAAIINTSVKESKKIDDLLKDPVPNHDPPKMKVDLQLVSGDQLKRDRLIGEVNCNVEKSASFLEAMSVKLPGPPGKLVARLSRKFNVPFQPYGLALMDDGNIIVHENCGSEVFIYKPNGQKVNAINGHPHTSMSVTHVASVDNKILVVSNINLSFFGTRKQLYLFKRDGSFQMSSGAGFNGEAGMCVHKNKVYITSSEEHNVYVFDHIRENNMNDIRNQQVFACSYFENHSSLHRPRFVACNDTHVAVTCLSWNALLIFYKSGKITYRESSYGVDSGLLGVVFDPDGRLFISDCQNDRIRIVSTAGELIDEIDLQKDGLSNPVGLALSDKGELVVAASASRKIGIYKYSFQ